MGLRIQNNVVAMNAHRNLTVNDAALSKSLERLSSGYRINSAKDDAAGLSISQGFRADLASYRVASRNVTEANALLQTAEGAMDQIGNMLTRLKELATQAASANAASNIGKIDAEGDTLIVEIDRIANSTAYAGTKLVDGSFGVGVSVASATLTAAQGYVSIAGLQSGQTYTVSVASLGATSAEITIVGTAGGQRVSQTISGITKPSTNTTKDVTFSALGLTLKLSDNFGYTTVGVGDFVSTNAAASEFQVGAKSVPVEDRIGVTLTSLKAAILDPNLKSGQMATAVLAQTFLSTVDSAISILNNKRGALGAAQNRLGYASANLASTMENLTAADSVIRDVDMAAEMTTFTKSQILLQAGTAMLAQANMAPQGVLSLFK